MTRAYEPSPLKFSLEEAVSFRKGEEIAELHSLALEPNISLHDLEHFVSIRGSLEMIGEYKRKTKEMVDEEDFSFSGQKYVTVVETREDGIDQFTYNFPVDITIPKSRVQNLEELDLVIDSFDYTLEDDDTLVISTDISILGVYEEVADRADDEEQEEEVENETQFHEKPFEDTIVPLNDFDSDEDEEELTFTAEAQKEEVRPDEEEFNIPIEGIDNSEPGGLGDKEPMKFTGADSFAKTFSALMEETPEDNEVEKEQTAPVEALARNENEQAGQEDEHEEVEEEHIDEEFAQESAVLVRGEEEMEAVAKDEEDEIDSDDDEEVPIKRTEKQITYQPKEEKEEKETASLSLTDFFSSKEENNNNRATMRIYFVQPEDTLSDIAERYETNVSTILRANDLQVNPDLEAGQLLYIPVRKEKSKS